MFSIETILLYSTSPPNNSTFRPLLTPLRKPISDSQVQKSQPNHLNTSKAQKIYQLKTEWWLGESISMVDAEWLKCCSGSLKWIWIKRYVLVSFLIFLCYLPTFHLGSFVHTLCKNMSLTNINSLMKCLNDFFFFGI